MVARGGRRGDAWLEAIVIAAVLTAFCAVLFVYGLDLPFQLWPRF